MPIPDVSEKNSSGVAEVTIGATKDQGGTRTAAITVGGARTVPFMAGDGETGRRPVIVMDVLDLPPDDWPEFLAAPYGEALKSPGAWAKKCVEEFGADMVCLKLDGTHPDKGDKDADHAVAAVRQVVEAVGVPFVIWGSENAEKDAVVLPKVSQAVKGERALLGIAEQDNYRTITATAMADDHNLIAAAPLDINIGKQTNILVTEMGFPVERIVSFQSTGALGYGLEYTYSIHERQRLAALGGDKMMSTPTICDAGYESWRAKEARSGEAEYPAGGAQPQRGAMWEATTALLLLQAGADMIRLRHPRAVKIVKTMIDEMYGS